MTEAAPALGEVADRMLEDRDAVAHHVHEEEGEHADGEHGQGDARAVAEQPQPRERQAEVDREPGQGSEGDGLSEGHASGLLRSNRLRQP